MFPLGLNLEFDTSSFVIASYGLSSSSVPNFESEASTGTVVSSRVTTDAPSGKGHV